MDIKQIRKDFDNGVLLSRCTIAELINALESDIAVTTLTQRVADLEYTLRGRQAAIGEMQMNMSTQKEINRSLAAQLTSAEFTIAQRWHADRAGRVPKIQINPAAHDWAVPASVDLPDLISRLRASIAGKESFEEATVFVANIAAAIDLLEQSILAAAEAK